jgi:hypothetical protein
MFNEDSAAAGCPEETKLKYLSKCETNYIIPLY